MFGIHRLVNTFNSCYSKMTNTFPIIKRSFMTDTISSRSSFLSPSLSSCLQMSNCLYSPKSKIMSEPLVFKRMVTFGQLLRGIRKKRKVRCPTYALEGSPLKRGTCIKVYNTKPKKPNSAQRKVAKLKLTNGNYVLAAIPGIGHSLQQHSVVLIRGGHVRDLPGVRFKVIRGKYDFNYKENFERMNRRSKYSTPRPKKELKAASSSSK